MSHLIRLCLLLTSFVVMAESDVRAGRYMKAEDYVASSFAKEMPPASTLWMTGDLREPVERILGHRFAALRIRYWNDDETSVWILDEIGKELPITIGVTIRDATIVNVRVLEFRETRGWEVRYPFFTDQFQNARLDSNGRLSRNIDGITGATLSVGAVTRIAKVALILDGSIRSQG
jgi:FMN-binding domain